MNKKILLTIVTVSLLLAGCGKISSTNTPQQNEQSSPEASTTNSSDTKSPGKTTSQATIDAIDYNQYIKKTWVEKNGTSNFSFCISTIANGQITGRFTTATPAVPNEYDLSNLTGTINKDTAECQFIDKVGNKGNIKLVFKTNDEIEATIKLTDKSQYYY